MVQLKQRDGSGVDDPLLYKEINGTPLTSRRRDVLPLAPTLGIKTSMKETKLTDFVQEDSTDEQPADDRGGVIAAYRHDAHKMSGTPHESAPVTFAGVPVNQSIPHGADADAANLSRPSGKPTQTVETHETHYRLSLLSGDCRYDPSEFSWARIKSAVEELLSESDPEAMHRAWLGSDIVSGFNEAVWYPYTSLKYHTLLVAVLFDNYDAGNVFSNLRLVVDPAGEIVPHRTVFSNDEFSLRIDADDWGRPSARLGSSPWQSWASTWSRLTAHPLDTDTNREHMMLDTNLRRIQSWSAALQYIEDFNKVISE